MDRTMTADEPIIVRAENDPPLEELIKEMFTEKGSQLPDYVITGNGVQVSMTGLGRVVDNHLCKRYAQAFVLADGTGGWIYGDKLDAYGNVIEGS